MSNPLESFLHSVASTARLTGNRDVVADDGGLLAELVALNTIAALPHWSILQVAGIDASKFLQGQLSCDIQLATESHATLGAHCSPKGRMLSSFLIARPQADTYWLRVHADIRDSASAALGKYAVFSKARIEPQTQLIALGIAGPDAAAMIETFAGQKPAGLYAVICVQQGVIVQLDTDARRFECWLPAPAAQALWQQCSQFRAVGSAFWRWLDIRDGVATIEAGTVDTFIPQMLNYHLNGGVSFSKGCYTGQEIVARAQYRGQVKRHLLRAQAQTAAPVVGGDVVGAEGRTLGQIVGAVDRGDGYCELLLVAGGEDGDRPALYLRKADGAGGEVPLQVL